MVPLKDVALANALKGTGSTNGACIDNVGNLSCQVYKITLKNLGSRLQKLQGSIELYPKEGSGNVYSNLKWRELDNPTTKNECSTGSEGAMVANTSCTINGNTYTFNSSGVCVSGGC